MESPSIIVFGGGALPGSAKTHPYLTGPCLKASPWPPSSTSRIASCFSYDKLVVGPLSPLAIKLDTIFVPPQ